MDDKLNTWDLIHATMEVATYAKVQKTQQQLEKIKSAIERESAHQDFIKEIKNFIFDISRNIRLLEEEIENNSQNVYIMAKSLEQKLVNSGFSDEVFPDFNDKEYVFKTQKKITEVIEKSKACLSQSETQQSEIAIQYITELPILHQSIASKSSQESLRETDKQWRKLDKQQKQKNFPKNLGITGLIFSGIFFLPLILYGLAFIFDKYYFCGSAIIVISTFVTIGSIVLYIRNAKLDPNYTSLKISRENLEKQLMHKKDWQQIVNTFGDLKSEQFQKIYKERIDFLNQIFKSKIFSEFSNIENETKIMHHSSTDNREDNEKEDNTFTFPCANCGEIIYYKNFLPNKIAKCPCCETENKIHNDYNKIQADDNQQDEFSVLPGHKVSFKCKNCGKDIYIKYLKSGELSKCKHCNTENIVPDYTNYNDKIECPYCAEMINKYTKTCPFCGKEIKDIK